MNLTRHSGHVLLPRHHGASTQDVTAPAVSALSVAVTEATVPTAVIVQTVGYALHAVAALPHAVNAVHPLARMTAASATTTVVTVTDQGALLTATAR